MSLYHAKLSYWKFSTRIDCKYSNKKKKKRYRDGEPLSGTISKTIQVTLRYVVIASCINIEYNLDAEGK